jgi:hypothetical protein
MVLRCNVSERLQVFFRAIKAKYKRVTGLIDGDQDLAWATKKKTAQVHFVHLVPLHYH